MRKTTFGSFGSYEIVEYASGIVTVTDKGTGVEHSPHPNIGPGGSVAGMRKKGLWEKDDRVVRSGQYHYNTDQQVYTNMLDVLAGQRCRCGANHQPPKVHLALLLKGSRCRFGTLATLPSVNDAVIIIWDGKVFPADSFYKQLRTLWVNRVLPADDTMTSVICHILAATMGLALIGEAPPTTWQYWLDNAERALAIIQEDDLLSVVNSVKS